MTEYFCLSPCFAELAHNWHTEFSPTYLNMPLKFGFGPLEDNSTEPPSRIRARIHFFHVIEELEPKAVTSLHDGVFIIFLCFVYLKFESRIKAEKPLEAQTVGEALRNIRSAITPEDVRNLMSDWQALNRIEDARLLRQSLKAWGESWKLSDEWCLYFATRALRLWLFHEFTRYSPPSWHYAFSGQFCDDDDLIINAIWDTTSLTTLTSLYKEVYGTDYSRYGFQFGYKGVTFKSGGWNPFYTEIGEWRKEVNHEFDMHLESLRRKGKSVPRGIKRAFTSHANEHINLMKSVARKQGFKPSPKKWNHDHFKWLAYYQVLKPNWSLQKIARQYNAELKTVSDGIKRTTNLIGLTLRSPLPPGRKRRPS